LAFHAPPDVTIHRQEVVERIEAENRFNRRERLVEACCH
jgi:sRNA-binding carbon storage regulator CsrA